MCSSDLSQTLHIDIFRETCLPWFAAMTNKENYDAQTLFARSLMTKTWRSEAGEWKLHLVQAYAMLKDPPAISFTPEPLQPYPGRYLGGNDLLYLIGWDGKQLQGGGRAERRNREMAEVRDVLYISGQPRSRRIFPRDRVPRSRDLWIDVRVRISSGTARVSGLLKSKSSAPATPLPCAYAGAVPCNSPRRLR